jgi:organic hydroperoxide reductase OsmC/OhrA
MLGGRIHDHTAYGRRFRVAVAGKPDLPGSADPAFLGEFHLHDPEALLVAVVASCHMLTDLALCARAASPCWYSDSALGSMIALRPRVVVARAGDPAAAIALHERAHELCLVASTCNFPIRRQAEARAAGASR